MPSNPKVFFDVTIGGQPAGRIVMELFSDVTLSHRRELSSLCTGERGAISLPGTAPEESIYGAKFADENFIKKHTGPGVLSMATPDRGLTDPSFFICTAKTRGWTGSTWCSDRSFEGMDVVRAVEKVGTRNGKTLKPVYCDCDSFIKNRRPPKITITTQSGNVCVSFHACLKISFLCPVSWPLGLGLLVL
ncbi:hypothetical protein F3Y22_tig00017870pilonHSYRG00011 [Hibiscus syriacus]|uniref:PPIase cyclophilin-type domain-containing protein n=1 Tax=Hibiscus syriacus TaxID=106335 RepID=A0A6A3C117_HIBSY|nr:hypothetical protein F3Y22_tig00017870pilonHSYRG00011 [Hibiscus syriacus]